MKLLEIFSNEVAFKIIIGYKKMIERLKFVARLVSYT